MRWCRAVDSIERASGSRTGIDHAGQLTLHSKQIAVPYHGRVSPDRSSLVAESLQAPGRRGTPPTALRSQVACNALLEVFRRVLERTMYYLENPVFARKRVGRAIGIVPPPQSSNVMQRANETE